MLTPLTRSPKPRRSIRLLELGFTVLAVMLGLRLANLQLLQAPELKARALAQRTKRIDLAALRREIVDRHGSELAVSVEGWSVYAHPSQIRQSPGSVAQVVAPILGIGAQRIASSLRRSQWTWLVRKKDAQVANRLRALRIPGLGVVRETRRVYPKGAFAATLLGFVGIDNQGLAGIEHDFDSLLRGKPRYLDVQVDAMGREILREAKGDPLATLLTDSSRVVLTLDELIQHEAERLLAGAIKAFGAKRGTVIVSEPKTGDILAFATLPSYDPNHPGEANASVVANQAVGNVFEPGSAMKPFTIAAALEAGVISPTTMFSCPPRMKIGKRSIGDHDPQLGTRWLSVGDILQVSSNVGTAKIAFKMPVVTHRSYLQQFGFGSPTRSGLGGESAGILPGLPWKPIRQATVAYGQGISVTALQLVTAAGIFANGGYLVKPRIVARLVGPDGSTIQDFAPSRPKRALSNRVARVMVSLLEAVTQPGGTGTAARVPGYHVAGKTGTAQKVRPDGRGYSSAVVSSFIGFAPAREPRIVVLASLDSPTMAHYASQTTAPLFREVAGASLRHLGIAPEPPDAVRKKTPSKHAAL